MLTLGRVWGGVVTYIAAMTSCALTFVTIRALGGDALRLLENRLAVQLLRSLDAHPVASVALLRVLFQTMPALNYALAMSGLRFRPYLMGTLLGCRCRSPCTACSSTSWPTSCTLPSIRRAAFAGFAASPGANG